MKISCAQMDMRLGDEAYNYAHAEELIREAVGRDGAGVVVLPETWNTGYFPEDLAAHADQDGERTKGVFSALAKELNVNIVCGSVVNRRGDKFYNTAYVFDRAGACVATCSPTPRSTSISSRETTPAGFSWTGWTAASSSAMTFASRS